VFGYDGAHSLGRAFCMNVLIVIAHPNSASFNYALLDSVVRGLKSTGHRTHVRDLYRDPFTPVLGETELAGLQEGRLDAAVINEQEGVSWAESLVFIYPLWWFDRPAVLKGWCDRVLTHGFAFRYGENGGQGMLPQEKAMVLVTAGGTEQEFTDMRVNSKQLLFPMTGGTLEYCGISDVKGHLFFDIGGVSDGKREDILSQVNALGTAF